MIAADARFRLFDSLDSTNLEAQRRVAAGDCGPAWIEAVAQTAGRGRRGRSWAGLEGNLFLTHLGQAEASPGELALLGFAAALAVADVADAALGPERGRVRVKWPNDVLIDGAKWAGILLESGRIGPGRLWFALGVGLNLAAAPADLPYPATSLAAQGVQLDRAKASGLLRGRLIAWGQVLAQEGFAPLKRAWEARAHGLGAEAAVEVGGRRIAGRALGLDDGGALRLGLAEGGETAIAAGDVYFPDL